MGSAPVPGGLSTSLGRAAVADPDTNTWGARIVAIEGTRAAGVDAIVWFADANALVSALAVEIPLWNVDPSSEDDTVRAQNIANIGSRIVAGGGAGPETLQFTIPALQQILAKDATIAWIGSLEGLLQGEQQYPIELRSEFRGGGDGIVPIAADERDAFVQFLRDRAPA
jgi:hypothetical protein